MRMNLREAINDLEEHPEYKYVLIIPGRWACFYDYYTTKKEATHSKREYNPNGTVMRRDKFIEKYKGA